MIGVFTGLPGAGKTLFALTWIKQLSESEKRPVFYSGIADLKLPWIEIDPLKWMDCPAGSIIVIDECQRVFRPRANGSTVPEAISAMETHRHRGVDIYLITQHPMLIDQNIRRLAGLHFHVVRKWGTQSAIVHEWLHIKENCDKSRADSTQHAFKYPKDAYAFYKSAEVHTHKARIPTRVYVLAAVPLVLAALGYRIYSSMSDRVAGPQLPGSAAGADVQPGRAVPNSIPAVDYFGAQKPRVYGLAYTAPVYDQVTKPVRAPYPAACIANASRCQCYTQQGTRLDVPGDLCRGIAAGGFFVAWDDRDQVQRVVPRPVPAAADRLVGGEFAPAHDLTPGYASAAASGVQH